MMRRALALLALLGFAVSCGGGGGSSSVVPPAAQSPTAAPALTLEQLTVTFYGYPDNTPPSCAIAYPVIHTCAGGTGTYADPITFATDKAEFAPGTIVYVESIQKYAIMEDDCVECDADWTNGRHAHIDVWLQSDASSNVNAVLNCENDLTQTPGTIALAPPPTLTVSSTPLFANAGNLCFTLGPAPTSSPVGNTPAPTPT